MTRMVDAHHIWNVIYTARRNRHRPPTWPSILRLPRKIAPQNLREICRKQLKRHLQCAADSSIMRPCSEHLPSPKPEHHHSSIIRHLAPARSPKLLFAIRRRILYWKLKHFALRLSLPKFQLTLRLPRKVTLQHFNVACATTSGTATSPTAASATKKELQHDWTGYCAWHKKWLSRILTIHPAMTNEMWVIWDWCQLTELLLDWAVTWLNCYLTELLLNCYLTELLLNCYLTGVLLGGTVVDLLLHSGVTLLNSWRF